MPQKRVSIGCVAKHNIEQPAEIGKPLNDQTTELLKQKQYQELASQHLDNLHQVLFAELTGLHFHIVWTSLHPLNESSPHSNACSVCCRLADGIPLPNCHTCGARHLELAHHAGERGHRFICGLGVSNYWFPINVRGLIIGTAFVQALDKTNHILQRHMKKKTTRTNAPVLDRAEFDHAAHLLRFIAQSVETATESELNQSDATQIRQAIEALQQEQNRLHEHIQRLLPDEHQLSAHEHHSPPPLVQRMLDYVHRHHAEPITLQECARVHGHNAAYLSNLFSQAVGLPFKTYLTELRLEKAKKQLSDPNRNINEIAQSVGYASASRFRLVFKKHTGLSPSHWRRTLRP